MQLWIVYHYRREEGERWWNNIEIFIEIGTPHVPALHSRFVTYPRPSVSPFWWHYSCVPAYLPTSKVDVIESKTAAKVFWITVASKLIFSFAGAKKKQSIISTAQLRSQQTCGGCVTFFELFPVASTWFEINFLPARLKYEISMKTSLFLKKSSNTGGFIFIDLIILLYVLLLP